MHSLARRACILAGFSSPLCQKKTLAESAIERATRLPFSNASTSVLIACSDFRKEHALCC